MEKTSSALFDYLLRIGDDRLVLGQRLAEWCGHGPILEEDLALGNVSLDLLGHAQALLGLAGKIEGCGRDEDKLAYFRDEREFTNLKLAELPRGDFAFSMVRQFLFDTLGVLVMDGLTRARHPELAAIAAKCLKEDQYHWRHSSAWVVRLGDGTQESHARAQKALDALWMYVPEFFWTDSVDQTVQEQFGIPLVSSLEKEWRTRIGEVLKTATLAEPKDGNRQSGGRKGIHTEHLGHMLAEMQILARSYPDARW